jgi:hypothetical protein
MHPSWRDDKQWRISKTIDHIIKRKAKSDKEYVNDKLKLSLLPDGNPFVTWLDLWLRKEEFDFECLETLIYFAYDGIANPVVNSNQCPRSLAITLKIFKETTDCETRFKNSSDSYALMSLGPTRIEICRPNFFIVPASIDYIV